MNAIPELPDSSRREDMIVARLATHFVYQSDPKGLIDRWRIMEMDGQGKFRGDCEDFALTALWFICERKASKFIWALLSIKYELIHCNVPEKHIVLQGPDERFCDNRMLRWVEELPEEYERLVPVPAPLVLLMMGLNKIIKLFN